MQLENRKNMFTNLFIKKEFKNIEKKIVIFIVTLLINLLLYNKEPILIVTPFLVLGYMMGFSYLIIVIMGSFIGAILFSPLAFYEVCLFVLLFLTLVIALKFINMKSEVRLLVTSYISDLLARYIFAMGIKEELTLLPLFYSVLTLVLTYLVINISKSLMDEGKKQYHYTVVLSILFIISLSLLGLDFYIDNISILFIVLSIYFLFCSKILDLSIYLSFLFINFIILLFFNNFNYINLYLLFIPCVVVNINNNKYIRLVLYLLASVILSLFFNIVMDYRLIIIYVFIALIYSLIPSIFLDYLKDLILNPLNNLSLYEKKFQRKEKEIENELESFKNLFTLVAKEYELDNENRLKRKKEDVIFHSLCINCHKNKVCYSKDERLKKLMFKSIESELLEEEINFINKECFKPSKFFELSELFKKDFYKEYKYNMEYQGLKLALKSQMEGMSNVLSQYIKHLNIDNKLELNYENEAIKNLLDQNQYDVLYVNFYEDYRKNININLCLKIKDHQDIYKIKELISMEFNINLAIDKVSEYSLEGYYKIEFKSIKEYQFLYGVHQINLKEEGNGDSYLVYENDNYVIYSLSDGMGYGTSAKVESRFTLNVLKGILDTGMDLKNGITLMNSLLKVKNRHEMYATLDLVSINKKYLKAHFFKNGSMPSYIYSSIENRLIKINSSSLPIGIVNEVNSSDFSYKLHKDDFIIMFSDGISVEIDELELFFKQIKEYNPQIVAREIAMRFKNTKEVDDVSVLVVKVEA